MRRLLDRVLLWEGSTRQIAILRFAAGMLIWAEYAARHAAFRNHAPGDMLFGILLIVSAGCMAFGVLSRISSAAAAGCLVYGYHYVGVHLGIKEPFVHAHTYILMATTVFLAMLPTGRSLSFDRWWALRRQDRGGPPPKPEWGALWPLALIRYQLALVYFWGAVDKSNVAFLSGSRLQQMYYSYYGSHEGVRLPLFDALMTLGGIGTVLLEYGLAFGLWFAAPRRWLIPLGITFHAAIYVSFPVGTFSVLSCILYLAYFPPAQVHDWVSRMAPAGDPAPSEEPAA